MTPEQIPHAADLKPDTERIDHQGQFGSCVAHSVQSALELLHHRAGQPRDYSRAYLYYTTRRWTGNFGGSSDGAFLRDVPKALTDGCCLEPDWPYTADSIGQTPPPNVVAAAMRTLPRGAATFASIPISVESIRRSIAKGVPVNLAIYLSGDWPAVSLCKNWRQTVWHPDRAGSWGTHAVLAVGYDDAVQRLLIENSYGPDYGDGGFFGLEYAHVATQVYECYRFTAAPVAPVPVPGYTAGDVPTFDFATSILTLPNVTLIGADRSRSRYKNVTVRLSTLGTISTADDNWRSDAPLYYAGTFGGNTLILPEVLAAGTQHRDIKIDGLVPEVLSATEDT